MIFRRRKPSRPSPARDAFTLIEITVVILILGVVAAVAAPRYSDAYRVTQLEAIAIEIAEEIRQVRQYAINHGQDVTLVFNNAAGTYQCATTELSGQVPSEFSVSADIDSQQTIDFDYSGTPRVSGSPITDAIITLTWSSNQYFIQIGTGTGRVWVMKELPAGTDGSSGGS